jgi:hypothetical protein
MRILDLPFMVPTAEMLGVGVWFGLVMFCIALVFLLALKLIGGRP